MKKTIFASFAVLLLLSLLVVTCDVFSSPPDTEDDLPWFTEDGRPMAHLTVKLADSYGAGRALFLDQAKNNTDAYEVAFLDSSGAIHRKYFTGVSTTMAVPIDDYPGSSRAVVFAGRGSDTTLLGIGNISEIGYSSGNVSGATEITATTNSVTFRLVALTNNVKKGSESTFHILGPTGYSTETGTNIEDSGEGYPIFAIPGTSHSNVADSTRPSFDTTNNIVGQFEFLCGTDNANYGGVKLHGDWFVGSSAFTGGGRLGTSSGLFTEARSPESSALMPSSGKFYFNIHSSSVSSDGFSTLYIDVPVSAIQYNPSDTTNSKVWHIKGGLNNTAVDYGKTSNSTGGAVVLKVGNPLNPITIHVPGSSSSGYQE